MWVSRVEVFDFRSYEEAGLDLEPGATVLLGSNGNGKTNLVEAVGFAATLESHRIAKDSALVRWGAERAVIRVSARVRQERDVVVELQIDPSRTCRPRINGAEVPRTRDVLGHVRCVMFTPEDVRLVKGEPADRRRFIDEVMFQVSPRYAGVRGDYDKVLKQRSALLRTAPSRSADVMRSMDVWDERLAELGGDLMWGRLNAVRRLADPMAVAYALISPTRDDALIEYVPSVSGLVSATSKAESARMLLSALRDRRDEEMSRGVTLSGPHRDDLRITLCGNPVRGFASHGESWSLGIALRLASFDVMRSLTGDSPVLVLDDVFAELDADRRERLVAAVSAADQILVTAAVAEDVPKSLARTEVYVSKGEVSRLDF
ncbi:MAG: DNA replication/repair protein RecF [Candidatus Nanopelagicales bacterium]|nr:DNA replication/repair protein RecF [Candidatus Nanopelagicales bacterium]